MGVEKECFLQTFVGTPKSKNGEKILRQELWWKVVEMRNENPMEKTYKYVLLKFKSKADREKFKKVYCVGQRMLGVKTFAVKFSPWKDVPKMFMNLEGIYMAEKAEIESDGNGEENEEKTDLSSLNSVKSVEHKVDLSSLNAIKPVEHKVDMIKFEDIVITREKAYVCSYPIKISLPKPLSDEGMRRLASYVEGLFLMEERRGSNNR